MANQLRSTGRRRMAAPPVTPLLSALGDPTRQQIVEQLRGGPCTVSQLAERLPVTRPAVSQHLKVLREAGLVTESRAGVRHYFALDSASLDALRRHFEGLWQDVMLAFAAHVKQAESARKSK